MMYDILNIWSFIFHIITNVLIMRYAAQDYILCQDALGVLIHLSTLMTLMSSASEQQASCPVIASDAVLVDFYRIWCRI